MSPPVRHSRSGYTVAGRLPIAQPRAARSSQRLDLESLAKLLGQLAIELPRDRPIVRQDQTLQALQVGRGQDRFGPSLANAVEAQVQPLEAGRSRVLRNGLDVEAFEQAGWQAQAFEARVASGFDQGL